MSLSCKGLLQNLSTRRAYNVLHSGWKFLQQNPNSFQNFPSVLCSFSSGTDQSSLHVEEIEGGGVKKDGEKSRRKVKLDQSVLTKLHRRELTEREREEDTILVKSLENLEAEDTFGSSYTSKNERAKIKKLKKERSASTNEKKLEEVNRSRSKQSNLKSFYPSTNDDEFLGKQIRRKQKDWANTFGTLSGSTQQDISESYTNETGYLNEKYNEDDKNEDGRPFIRLSATDRRNKQIWYGMQIEKLGKQGKVKEAIEVLEEWMLKRDRVLPTPYVFTALIGVLGRAGYTHKAFKLFVKMKQMALQPEDPTYTALFNACSNSPFRGDGLSRATRLREQMLEKGYQPNLITYKAMVKTFGMCGDLRTAFSLMDEASNIYKLDPECFSFLLMACISDKEAGFKHAIEVWRLMLTKKVEPDLPLYNLLLRTVRDCGAGDRTFANQLLNVPADQPQLADPKVKGGEKTKRLEAKHLQVNAGSAPADTDLKQLKNQTVDSEDDSRTLGSRGDNPGTDLCRLEEEVQSTEHVETSESSMEWWQYEDKQRDTSTSQSALILTNNNSKVVTSSDPSILDISQSSVQKTDAFLPDILNPRETLEGVLALGDLNTPENRLALLGGTKGFLKRMEMSGTPPDVRIFAQLLDNIPSTIEAELDLLALMESKGVKPDVDLFNMLIHKRCMRLDYQAGKDVLLLVAAQHLSPNLRTFGCIALTCRKKPDGLQLIQDIQTAGLMPNTEIMGTLVKQSYMDFSYKRALLREIDNLAIQPNQMLIEHIEKAIIRARKIIVNMERQSREFSEEESKFYQNFWKFMEFYEAWLQRTQFDKPTHPWAPFGHQKDKQPQEAKIIV